MLSGALMSAFLAALMGAPSTSHAQYALPRAESGAAQSATGGLARVVGGQAASRAQWRSFVLVRAQTASGKTMTCGGTVIGRQWVLTAGHCVAGKSASDFTIVEDIDDLNARGHTIQVDRIVLHGNFADGPPRNDIALLHLASPANSARQALISRDLARSALRGGTNTVLAGFGLTTPQPVVGAYTGSISNHLLQVDLAVVERPACARVLAQVPHLSTAYVDALDDSMVCAGDPTGGRDSCKGDSGGPLAVVMKGRQVQAGVVSWGPGCGLRGTVGVYTSVGYFEDWIRQRAPDAVFVARDEELPPPPTPVAPSPSSTPRPSTQPCGLPPPPVEAGVRLDVAEGVRVRIGEAIHVRATPNVTGQLLVFNIDTGTCRTFQVFPNKFANGGQVGSVIAAGATVSIPGPADAFVVRAQSPAGRNRLYAMIVPAGVPIDDLASRGVDMRTLVDPPALWRELSSRAWRTRDGAPPVEAIGMYSYEIVP